MLKAQIAFVILFGIVLLAGCLMYNTTKALQSKKNQFIALLIFIAVLLTALLATAIIVFL